MDREVAVGKLFHLSRMINSHTLILALIMSLYKIYQISARLSTDIALESFRKSTNRNSVFKMTVKMRGASKAGCEHPAQNRQIRLRGFGDFFACWAAAQARRRPRNAISFKPPVGVCYGRLAPPIPAGKNILQPSATQRKNCGVTERPGHEISAAGVIRTVSYPHWISRCRATCSFPSLLYSRSIASAVPIRASPTPA